MGHNERAATRIVGLFLLALFCLVHCLGPATPAFSETREGARAAKQKPAPPRINYSADALPAPVQEMREAILEAVRSGRIEDLRHAYELNELKPELGPEPVSDPVAYWRQVSGDGEGREILAVLGELLEGGYVVLPLGRDVENNRVYVWPYFAELPLDKLTAAQQVEMLRLVPAERFKAMRAAGKYDYWRLVIGADGTWHSLRKP
jgi:hypothetical protein